MKKFLFLVALILVFSVIAEAQYSGSIPYTIADGKTYFIKLRSTAELDHIISDSALTVDTCETINLRRYNWDLIGLWVKCSGVGTDSIQVVNWVDVKSTSHFNSAAVGDGLGWRNVDSMLTQTADSLYGDYKQLSIPLASEQLRVRVAAIADCVTKTSVESEVWLCIRTRRALP